MDQDNPIGAGELAQAYHAPFIRLQRDRIRDALAPYMPNGRFALVDFPDHANVGDSAIWLGEAAFFRDTLGHPPDYVSRYRDFSLDLLRQRVPSGPVFIHGGGNFGDIWLHHHRFREFLLETLRDRPIVQLPQSIQFGSEEARDRTARLIAEHGNVVVLVRDRESLDLARRYFDCPSLLVPDMAFCLGALPAGPPSRDLLALLRTDSESIGVDTSLASDIPIEDWLCESRWTVRATKIGGLLNAYARFEADRAREQLLTAAAAQRVRRGLRQLSTARAIVTDRLHCVILSLLLGRPVAVLDNNYGKLERFLSAWDIRSERIYPARSFADAVAWARGFASSGGH